ncbi:MAG TPA: hypothetical protein VMZ05_08530, partial [Spirochaetota bacterium]|nr:hypothetical protein [Spirochaetota bacterium]
MGLLSKAATMSEKEEKGKHEGLMEKSSLLSESRTRTGLLERAEKLLQSEESEAEEGETQGLLQKARALTEKKEPIEGGLLEKAEAVEKREEGLLEKVTVVEEEGFPRAGLLERAIEQKKRGEKPSRKKPAAKKPSAEKPTRKEPAAAKLTADKLTADKLTELEVTEKYEGRDLQARVTERDLFGAAELFSRIIEEEGYEGLLSHILRTACELGKGRSGMLFALKGEKYSVIAAHVKGKQKKGVGRQSYRKGSELVKLLNKAESKLVQSSLIVKEPIKAIEPWVAVPIFAGPRLTGFFIVGDRPKRAKVEPQDLLFLSYLSALFVNDYALREDIRSLEEKLFVMKEEKDRVLGLYDYSDERKGRIKDALDRCSDMFHIDTALLVTGYERKGSLDIPCGIGITDDERRKFKITRGDREIAGIVSKGEPKVPKDAGKRLSLLAKELEREFRTYIVVPVVFHGNTLATLIVLDMKGGRMRISKRTKAELSHTARFFVSYLLYDKLMEIDPFESLEFDIESTLRESERRGGLITLVTCTVRNIDKRMDSEKYARYRAAYERLYRSCREIVAEDGSVRMVSWKRIVIFIHDFGSERVDGIIGRIRERFSKIVKREGLQKLTISLKAIPY